MKRLYRSDCAYVISKNCNCNVNDFSLLLYTAEQLHGVDISVDTTTDGTLCYLADHTIHIVFGRGRRFTVAAPVKGGKKM